MAGPRALLDSFRAKRALAFVTRLRDGATLASGKDLPEMRRAAARFRHRATQAERALTARLIEAVPERPMRDLPGRTDWSHRPMPWATRIPHLNIVGAEDGTALSDGVTLHHDCTLKEITVRQIADANGRHGVSLDALGFDGSYLSLAMALPNSTLTGLSKEMLFRVDLDLKADRVGEVYARLNLRHGPNTEKLVRGLEPGAEFVDFDLFYADLDPADVTGIWLDIILQDPMMNRLLLNDVVVSRRPRANV